MLNIIKEHNGEELIIKLAGRLDTSSALKLDKEVKSSLEGVKSLVFDFSGVIYISSAGLRIMLYCHKVMKTQEAMVIRNTSEDVKEIFKVTGFADIFHIE